MELFNISFVIWREAIEALLIIGVLNAWLGTRTIQERRIGRLSLWSGVGAGVVGAIGLAVLLLTLGEALSDDTQIYFQTSIVIVAAALIVQMVIWMRRHGRTLKSELNCSLNESADRANWCGVFTLAALAILREGSEVVIFLYGIMSGAATPVLRSLVAVTFGLAAAALTYWSVQFGSRFFSWRTFFRVTEVILLLLAGSLLMTGVDNMISLSVLPKMSQQIWDTSSVLSDGSGFGGLVSSLIGYRAKPVLTELLIYLLYWVAVTWLIKSQTPAKTR